MLIYKELTFDSAHYLPNVSEGHKCRQLHGHTYFLTVYMEGEVLSHEGWVLDFDDMRKAVGPVIRIVDHALLNNIPGLENPTAELLVIWLWDRMQPLLHGLKRLELKETPTSGVIYEGK